MKTWIYQDGVGFYSSCGQHILKPYHGQEIVLMADHLQNAATRDAAAMALLEERDKEIANLRARLELADALLNKERNKAK